jgi:hypothetical protein
MQNKWMYRAIVIFNKNGRVFYEKIFEPTKDSGFASRRCSRCPHNQGLFAVSIPKTFVPFIYPYAGYLFLI